VTNLARSMRLRRLYRHSSAGLLVVPLDHSVTVGAVAPDRTLSDLVDELAGSRADAVVLHKGDLRHVDHLSFTRTSLIVHLSAGTALAVDPHARCLVATVEEAVGLGADAVSVHVNLGAADDQRQLADLGRVAAECERWGVPLLAMVYPRGPKIGDPVDPEHVAHAAAVAAGLGADIVKTVYPGSVAALADITRACPIPVLVAGGPRRDSVNDVLAEVQDAMRGGAAGVAIGRNIFATAAPGAVAQKIADLVHGQEEW
jgi:2-amino-4,5-dihydroxy-6-oxo-7-(phosphooxy)heptanoate synthase